MADPTPKPITIRTSSLRKSYGKRVVVKDVSLSVTTGEVVGLLGPNGAGKTTTFKMMVGFTRPDSGAVFYGDRDISRLPIHERARLGIGYLAQETSVFRMLTVRENLKAVLEARGVGRREMRERVDQLVEELGIGHVERQLAGTLSGGEKRRVEIARALALQPSFIFLDEPFAAIDPKTVEDLQRIIAQLRQRGLGLLITDHNVRETLRVTDRAYLMLEGSVLASGAAAELAANEDARRGYLTESIARDLLADSTAGFNTPQPGRIDT